VSDSPTGARLSRLVGTWTTELSHPGSPGLDVHGTAAVEWLEGERFLVHRARTDHADFPDSISVIGATDRDRVDDASNDPVGTELSLSMHYFDSRGVFRVYEAGVDDEAWRLWRDAPGFSQRFTGRFVDGGDTIAGQWELCRDDVVWEPDLQITYRRNR
jgi:hypothetical protein